MRPRHCIGRTQACHAHACHDQCTTDNAHGSNDTRAATACAETRRKRKCSTYACAQTRNTERAPCDARDREGACDRHCGAPSEDPQQKHEQRRVIVHLLCAALQMRAGSCRCTAPTHACAVALEHVHCPSYPRICFQVRALSGLRHICAGTGGCGFRACTGDQPLLADREDGHALRNVRGRAHAAARRREVKEFDRRRCEQ